MPLKEEIEFVGTSVVSYTLLCWVKQISTKISNQT